MKLEGKIALVTGASQGLGKAIALKLAENGADVAIIFVGPQEPALETKAEIEALGRRAECYPCDVRDEQGGGGHRGPGEEGPGQGGHFGEQRRCHPGTA